MATLKISKARLLDSLSARITELKSEYEKQLKKYEADKLKDEKAVEAFRTQVLKAAKAATEFVMHAADYQEFKELLDFNYNERIHLKLGQIGSPTLMAVKPKLNIEELEATIRKLKLCPDEVISLKENDDYLRYV